MNAFMLFIILLVAVAQWRVVVSALAAGVIVLTVLGIVYVAEEMHLVTAMA